MKKTIFWLVPLGIGSWLLLQLIHIWSVRLFYPYDLEWMEGGMLVHALRISQGQEIYVAPSTTFVPYLYAPGYAWLLGKLAAFVPLDYTLGRIISLLGTFSAAGALIFGIKKQGGNWWSGLVAAMLFLGSYTASGGFYDLVRTDGLAIGLLAWSLVMVFSSLRYRAFYAGILLALAFMTKQHVALFGAPMLFAFWQKDGQKQAIVFVASAMLPALLMIGWWQWTTQGHFLRYVLEVPASHPIRWKRFFPGIFEDIGRTMPFSCYLVAGFLWWRSTAETRWRDGGIAMGVGFLAWWMGIEPSFAYISTACAMGYVVSHGVFRIKSAPYFVGTGLIALLIAMLMRGHIGGFINVLMPLHWVICAGVGLVGVCAMRVPVAPLIMAVQLFYQMIQLHPEKLMPTAADRKTGDAIVAYIAKKEGNVWSPLSPWLCVQAGKEPYFSMMGLWDIDHAGGVYAKEARAIQQAPIWDWVLMDSVLKKRFQKQYRFEERLPGRMGVFYPKTGMRARPKEVWGRRSD